jgi:hypothetical protein
MFILWILKKQEYLKGDKMAETIFKYKNETYKIRESAFGDFLILKRLSDGKEVEIFINYLENEEEIEEEIREIEEFLAENEEEEKQVQKEIRDDLLLLLCKCVDNALISKNGFENFKTIYETEKNKDKISKAFENSQQTLKNLEKLGIDAEKLLNWITEELSKNYVILD